MYFRNKTAFLMCAALVLGACGNISQNTPSVSVADFVPPLIDLPTAEEVIPYADFTIMPAEGGSFVTDHGTKVTFPANAFAFADGTPVTEPVQVKFREFHNASEIMLSGIVMTAKNENGETLPFESAGMFDIAGQCAGKEVKIAEGKTAQIDLPNRKPDPNFNFYRLDGTGWTELQKNLPAVDNTVSEATRKEAEKPLPVIPVAPEKADEKTFVFDLDLDTDRYPELKELYGLMWQYAGEKGSATDPEKNKKITETNWTQSEIERNSDNTYNLVLRQQRQRMVIPVKPVLRGKSYAEAKARFDQKMDKYNAAMESQKQARQQLSIEDQYTRSLAISGFGVYNCDRFYLMPQARELAAQFRSNGRPIPKGTVLFHLIQDDVSIRLYQMENASATFKYGKRERNRLLAIFPDQTVGLVTAEEFAAVADAKGKQAEFDIKKLPLKNITPDNLEQVLAGI